MIDGHLIIHCNDDDRDGCIVALVADTTQSKLRWRHKVNWQPTKLGNFCLHLKMSAKLEARMRPRPLRIPDQCGSQWSACASLTRS